MNDTLGPTQGYTALFGWVIWPSLAAAAIQGLWYRLGFPVATTRPLRNSTRFVRHQKAITVIVILAYLVYTIYDIDQSTAPNHYDTLDLKFNDFSQKQLKTKFRKFSLIYHPDKVGQAGADTFVNIRAAHDVLVDPISRAAYDRFGPSSAKCTTCVTNKDHIKNGMTQFSIFYIGTGILLVVASLTGKVPFGRFWRFILLVGMAALEWAMIASPTGHPVLGWILPHRVTFEKCILLHRIYISTFIAVSRIGSTLFPAGESSNNNVGDLARRLEGLTTLSNTESLAQLQGVFDVFMGDDECLLQLKRQMGTMALDARITQDQKLNEIKSSLRQRMALRKEQ